MGLGRFARPVSHQSEVSDVTLERWLFSWGSKRKQDRTKKLERGPRIRSSSRGAEVGKNEAHVGSRRSDRENEDGHTPLLQTVRWCVQASTTLVVLGTWGRLILSGVFYRGLYSLP